MPALAKPAKGTAKAQRRKRTRDQKKGVLANMTNVRKRDGFCRFPLCGCRKKGIRAEVSHRQHRGMGGNPAGDRSATSEMIYLCAARHKDNRISVDRGTLRWEPDREHAGADGPVFWYVDIDALPASLARIAERLPKRLRLSEGAQQDRWVLVAQETGVNQYRHLTEDQRAILRFLGDDLTC